MHTHNPGHLQKRHTTPTSLFPHTQSHVTLQAKLELQQTVMPTITTTNKAFTEIHSCMWIYHIISNKQKDVNPNQAPVSTKTHKLNTARIK